jgi:hypothetical protein
MAATISTFPIWTLIVTLTRGKVTALGWDDGCFFCASNGPACNFAAYDANASVATEVPDATYSACASGADVCYPAAGGATLTVNATGAAALPSSTVT